MAADFSIGILADESEITVDVIAEVESRLLAVIQWRTVNIIHASAYSAGGSNNVTITISGGGGVTVDWGFQVLIDSAVGNKEKMLITAQVLQVVQPYTHQAIATASFSTGGTYETEATLT